MLLWLAGLLAAGVLALLLLPVRIDLVVDLGPDVVTPPARAHIRWLWLSWWTGSTRPSPAAPARHDQPMGPRRGGPIGVWAALRTPGFVARCARLVRELGRPLWPRRAVIRARIGLGDPYETGMLAGVLAAGAGVPRPDALDLEITPDFSEAILAVRAQLSWSLRPVRVLWPIATFVLAPVVWRAGRAAWKTRGRR